MLPCFISGAAVQSRVDNKDKMDSEASNGITDYYSLEISPRQFDKISGLVYQISGIDLHEGKEELVKARLLKRLRHLKITNFERYLKYLADDKSGKELRAMVDVLTTNKTHFFREAEHLDFLRDEIIPHLGKGPIRIWSAGCSSGEEPYSIAIVLSEAIPDIVIRDIRILATDISDRMMEKARRGIYDGETIKTVPPLLKQKYFESAKAGSGRQYQVIPQLQYLISFAKLNLMEEWPMRGPFEAIFCRNVMIYFDKPTQERLVGRFWSLLREGGYLFVGHSESLTFLKHDYQYLQPAVYRKVKPSEMHPRKRVGVKGK
ncbi:MAG TPA: protein-glutamate O-methyltransferase CheR [Smithella sp.]|nr:protein-glutamate O-methyltransferase CheR [Smithella sp.]HNY49407.1 protein-glutamate O-methyltransferase CheR [Smithella sp.]HOG89402.1 protein-glutamate O-methyltransferase CheR [Smithella sp.]